MPRSAHTEDLELRLDAPASPHQVLLAVTFLAAVVNAADSTLTDGAVTLIVENYALRSVLRGRSPAGKVAVQLVERVLADPPRAIVHEERGVDVAAAIHQEGRALVQYGARFFCGSSGRRKRELRELTSAFLESVHAAVKTSDLGGITRGTTVVYSKVLRIGRTRDRSKLCVRLVLDDRPQEVEVSRLADVSRFYEAAKLARVLPIALNVSWRAVGGRPVIVATRSEATAVDLDWSPACGTDAVSALRQIASGEASPEEVADLLDINTEH